MILDTPEIQAPLSSDGTADGYVTVADGASFYIGAKVWLRSNTVSSKEYILTEASGGKLGVRETASIAGGQQYGRTPVGQFLVADAAFITQPRQSVAVDEMVHYSRSFLRKEGDTMSGNLALSGNLTLTGKLLGNASNVSGAIGIKLGNAVALTNSSAKILSIYSDSGTTEVMHMLPNGSIIPTNDSNGVTYALGSSIRSFGPVFVKSIKDGSDTRVSWGNGVFNASSHPTNAANVGFVVTRYSTVGPLASFNDGDQTATGQRLVVENSGKLTMWATDASATPGAATIHRPSGQVAVASGASSVVVTCSVAKTTSVIVAVLQDVTDAVQIKGVVPATGSFTIHLTGATTAARKVGFVVFN